MKQIIDKPSPITGGLLELHTDPATVSYRGETISYDRSYYHCVDTGMEFADEELEKMNLKRLYDTYRRIHGIPTVEELEQMRERYGIPSSAMSLILGLGENQFGLYEEGTVPTPSVGRLLALAMEPANMRNMLQASRSSFSEKQYAKYFSAIAASMPPAMYKTEEVGLSDYGYYSLFPSAKIVIKPRALSRMRRSYYEYYYAPVCR